ncbi:hypothetical protein TEA_029033 [Camellia sinensis var. sinensis]|uniref:Lipoyl-binding domain-containing protein n=1 Tax=Camellia sinensis var. sinensis TaxID=542762 RepID=A0A4S4DL65_CAMSN|nr:hypothetical protein TEA_029033 [Camellia sinensis var. sinensis]
MKEYLTPMGPTPLHVNPIFEIGPVEPRFSEWLVFEGISVDESGRQHYLDASVAYKRAVLNAIDYLSKFGYSKEQMYLLLSCCPCEGRISGLVDSSNACAILAIPTAIFDQLIQPNHQIPELGEGTQASRDFPSEEIEAQIKRNQLSTVTQTLRKGVIRDVEIPWQSRARQIVERKIQLHQTIRARAQRPSKLGWYFAIKIILRQIEELHKPDWKSRDCASELVAGEGEVIKEGQVIGFLDQFGTELPVKQSDVAGEVIKLLFNDGEAVGYGDPLIAVLPSFHGIKNSVSYL